MTRHLQRLHRASQLESGELGMTESMVQQALDHWRRSLPYSISVSISVSEPGVAEGRGGDRDGHEVPRSWGHQVAWRPFGAGGRWT